MNCLIPGPNVKVLGRAIVALAKVGDELYMEAKPDKLSFLTLNQAKTICAQMHLLDSFFSLYDIDRPKQPRNVPICCKVHVKTMLQLLKGTQLDRKLESLKIELNPNSDSIQFKLKYKVDDIVLSQVLHLMEPEVLQLDDYSGPKNNNICAGNEFYNNLLVLFSNSDDDITLEISETKMIARNYVNGAPHKPKSVRSQVTLNSSEFVLYRISEATTINFPLKPLRAAIAFADVFSLNVGLDFDNGGSFNPYADGQSSTGTTSLPTRMNRVANSDTLPANKSGAQQDLTQEDLLAIANEDWQAFDERTNNSKAALRRISKEPIFNESREGGKRILSSESDKNAAERIKLGEYLFKGPFESSFEGNVLLWETDSE
ncbi:cell cycle checkpoint control protein RAD9A isoform X2 [Dendroctonus ponderosae]|uniref:cell cycle checkpoint control protein RAD9A isoform X2 n=1 Tax=Dendroctonus ponderosae TaxID=77166 RepID=UPI00203625FF|nr:cell cycle checkpoint control protein RAD9A isoform X2 [Dendroctonus ponderosae]